jgi:hypothetical protein
MTTACASYAAWVGEPKITLAELSTISDKEIFWSNQMTLITPDSMNHHHIYGSFACMKLIISWSPYLWLSFTCMQGSIQIAYWLITLRSLDLFLDKCWAHITQPTYLIKHTIHADLHTYM